jgi:RNA polymerase sigma factor (sigma-70 family)
MGTAPPPELTRLLSAEDQASQDHAWETFLRFHSRLLISTAGDFGGDPDAAMDRYAYVLEQLRRDDLKRLRAYVADERGKFTTWLVVVARRLCLDYRRRRYGRPRSDPDCGRELERVVRKRLVDFIAEDLDPSVFSSPDGSDPEKELRAAELRDSLSEALGSLSSRDRLLLAFRYERDLTARQIARLMQFPSVFHVYRHLKTVQRSLRTSLEAKGVDSATP